MEHKVWTNKIKDIWLNTEEACLYLGINRETLRKYCAEKKLIHKKIKKNRRYEFQISFHSLNAYSQEKYLIDNNYFKPQASQDPFLLYNKAPSYAKAKADKYMQILTFSKGLNGSELEEFLEDWNRNNPALKACYCSVMLARKKYNLHGIAGLLGQYGKSQGRTRIKDNWNEYFRALYLNEGQPTIYSCWLHTLGYAIEVDVVDKNDFPHPTSFIRKLKKEVPEQSIYLARHGESQWNRKYANYIERDYSDLLAGDFWVSDHAQLDVMCVKKDGSTCCPWVTAWVDMKTNKWLGWLLHVEAGNSDHIFQTFYYAATDYGVPEDIYIDNGKDYRAKDFAGGRKESDTVSMITRLGITPHFALPYNGQSKPIERAFLKNKELLSKLMKGYRGGNVVERPEKLRNEIKNGKLLAFEELKDIFDDFIVNVVNKLPSQSKKLNGMSPDELWAKEFKLKRVVSPEALKMFCMRASNTVTIKRNGIKDSEFQVNYWGEWMSAHKGTKVYIRRDIKDFSVAYVFDAKYDKLLGDANICDIAPVLAKDGISKSELQALSKMKKQDKKAAKDFAKTKDITTQDRFRHLKLGTKELANEFEETEPQVIQISENQMDVEIRKFKNKKKRNTYNINDCVPLMPKEKKIYLFESEIETEERELLLREMGI